MKLPHLPRRLHLVMMLALAVPAQEAVQAQCPGSNNIFVADLAGDSPGMDFCSPAGAFCDRAIPTAGPVYRLEDPSCDPATGVCVVQVSFQYEFPGNEDNGNGIVPWIFWFDRTDVPPGCDPSIPPPNPTCPDVDALCGVPGGPKVLSDFADTWFEVVDVSCGTAGNFTEVRSVGAYVCPTNGACRELTAAEGVTMGGPAMAAGIGCEPPPPVDDCDDCKACRVPRRGTSAGGGPPRNVNPAKSGPGTLLRYTARGVGHATYPGASLWNLTLGRYWSHDYAGRIVVDPDETHVWLLTKAGTFREFSDLVGGVYQTNSPSDEYRTLSYLGAGLGWELQSQDGTVQSFNTNGVWTQTVDRNGNKTIANYTGSQLTSVSFPDQRSEDFTYYVGGPQDGKLETITEVGIGGSPTRAWTYEWSGDDLIRIIRPDSTKWEFFYNDPRYPGYLTRMDLVGDDGTSTRIEAGWEYDDDENVIQTWKGETITDGTGDHPGPNAVDLYVLSFDNPTFPTQATITNPVGNTNDYTVARDDANLKPKITQITGDCPVCGVGSDTTFTYGDPNHPLRPTSQVDGEGNETHFTYGTGGQVLTRTEAVNDPSLTRTTSWTYDTNFPAFPTEVRIPSTETGMEKIVTMAYDPAAGDLSSRTVDGFEAGMALSGQTTTFKYNTAGQVTEVDPPGFTEPDEDDRTIWTYDEANRGGLVPLTRSDPVVRDFGSTSFVPDGFNRRMSETDPNGLAIETSYDDLDRVDQVIQRGATPAEDLVTDYEYNTFGDLEKIILPKLNVIEYGYGSAGRLTQIERKPDAVTPGEKVVYTLDGLGNRTREELQDAAGVSKSVTAFEYSGCQLTKVIRDPDAGGAMSTTEYAYDCNGNLKRSWDANHPSAGQTNPATQLYAYDALNRLTSVTTPEGTTVTTGYIYDVQDHLASVTDAEGNATAYTYSDRDLLTQQISPVSGTTDYTYNPHGELVTETDERGITVTRTVDELDRVTLVDYGTSSLNTTLLYDDDPDDPGSVPDLVGRLVEIQRGGETIEYRYDHFGRVTQDGQLTFGYDDNGNRTTVAYPGSVTATYEFNGVDRQKSLTVQASTSQSVITEATYLPSGPLSSLTFGNTGTPLAETRAHDDRYFPLGIDLTGASTLLDWDYTTDGVGNVTSIADVVDPARNRSFAYHADLYYVECAAGPWQPGSTCDPMNGGPIEWTYDDIGNRLTEQRGGQAVDTYVYGPGAGGNTPILERIDLGAGGTRDYTFGEAGHLEKVLASGGEVDFGIDKAGRVRRISHPAGDTMVELSYDGRGFLSQAAELEYALIFQDGFETGDTSCWSSTVGEGVTTTGTDCFEPGGPVAGPLYGSEGRLEMLEKQDDPSSPADRIYVFYLAGAPVAQLAVPSSGGETWTFLTTDHLGAPVFASDISGGETWQGGFEPFGDDYSAAQAAGVFLRLPGQWDDDAWQGATEGVELYYNLYRWYEYGTGRYNRPDPLGLSGGPHLYSYALSNPVTNADPLGLRTLGLGGVVFNFSDCCVQVSENAPEGGQQQRYIPPRSTSGTVDVDAIYFEDGGALKIPDWSVYIIYDCNSLKTIPTGFSSRPLLSNLRIPKYRTKPLPDRKTQEQEFGGPIFSPEPDCPCP